MKPSHPGASGPIGPEELPKVVVRARRGISIVWLVPLVAVGIGLWLLLQSLSERGVDVLITFSDARGLEAGKTKVKYRSIEVGVVKSVRLGDDLSEIVVKAEIYRDFEPYLTNNTQFWVARPRFGSEGISGLETFVSGTYVAVNPAEGAPARTFPGLDLPVPTSQADQGLKLVLIADRLGSLRVGSPVRYADFEIGEVEAYELLPDRQQVKIDLFIRKKHAYLVRTSSRFWNASGVEVKVGAEGVSLKAESLAAILGGAIAFETDASDPGSACKNGQDFKLYGTRDAAREPVTTRKLTYLMYFEGSSGGLKKGAPVEFYGLRVGEVRDVKIILDRPGAAIRIPVLVDLELERMYESEPSDISDSVIMEMLVAKGMRAQLKSGYIVAGRQYVDLVIRNGATPDFIRPTVPHPTFPTVKSQLDEIGSIVIEAYNKLDSLPLKDAVENWNKVMGDIDSLVTNPEIVDSMARANLTIESFGKFINKADGQVDQLALSVEKLTDQVTTTMDEARALLIQMRESVGDESPLRFEIDRVLAEFYAATRSVRNLADTLERDPSALIRGKQPLGGSK